MIVLVLVREDQSDAGYVDTTLLGVFARRNDAETYQHADESVARTQGLHVAGDPFTADGEWDVSWEIQEHLVA